MFKIAYCAGHCMHTPGKRMPAELNRDQTREWVLNDRVADFFAEAAGAYAGVALLRTDDPTGRTDRSIRDRTRRANHWGADLYIDMHHNAAGRVFSGGGVEAYACPGSTRGKTYRDAIYQAVIAAGNLKGDRSCPLQEKGFDSLTMTNMPAVLVEYGYMDSTVDAPVILTQNYAKQVGEATMAAVAKVADLQKKVPEPAVELYPLYAFVKDVQRACGAAVDGIAGPETLGKTVTLSAKRNAAHPAVRAVQKRLMALGYRQVGKADGIAGGKFTGAVKAFQSDHNCCADGEVTAGNKTWRKLLCMD